MTQSHTRIACASLLTARHLDPSGGISNFVLGLVKMLPDTMFDLVTDDATEAQKWFGILFLGETKYTVNPSIGEVLWNSNPLVHGSLRLI